MPILKIATVPSDEKLLRGTAKPILKITPRIQALIEDMLETMRHAAGVGLAAPQVYVMSRLFVYDIGEGPEALINPEVLERSGEAVDTEGCLSIPRLQGDVPRYTRLVVSGLNRRGRRVKIAAEDYLARVFQHEIDHLDGILFTDRADPESLHWITPEQEERRRRRREHPEEEDESDPEEAAED